MWFKKNPDLTNNPLYLEPRVTAAETLLAQKAIQNVKTKDVDISGYGKKNKILISFVSDDGQDTDYTILKPIFDKYNFKCCMALPTGQVNESYFDNPITDEHALELQGNGWEILSHTVNHLSLQTLTADADIEFQLYQSKVDLEAKGYKVNSLAYPHGTYTNQVKRIARKYYRSALQYSNGFIDKPPFDTYNIHRVSLGSWFDVTVDDATKYPDGTRNSYDTYYKPRVDQLIANGGWLIFGLHSAAPMFDAIQQVYLDQTLAYIQSLGIPVVTINDGLDLIGNIIDVSGYDKNDSVETYFRISSEGKINSNDIREPVIIKPLNTSINLNVQDLTQYDKGKITYQQVNDTNKAGSPTNASGLLCTDYSSSADDYVTQTYTLTNGDRYIRNYDYPNRVWTSWIIISKGDNLVKRVADNSVNATSPASSFTSGKITKTVITYTNRTGTPNYTPGVLTTDYTSGYSDYLYQSFFEYTTGNVYYRTWINGSSVWSEWSPANPTNSNTSGRPKTGIVGFQHFDTSLSKPIWLKTAGAKEVDTLTVSIGATTSGNITITLGGIAFTIAVSAGDSSDTVASKIRSGIFNYWLTSGTSGTVIFTKTQTGINTAPVFTDTDATGVTGSFAVTTAGTNNVWVDASGTTV